MLALAVEMLLKKSLDGLDVGLILCEPEQEIGLHMWIKQFEALHECIFFNRTAYTMKSVSIGMFVWAVKCGFINESKLCENLRRFHGSLLYQDVNLCHGSSLVDEDVAGFVRCVFCVVSCCVLRLIVVVLRNCSDESVLPMSVCRSMVEERIGAL